MDMAPEPLGLARGEVRLVPYDPRWPGMYERAARELSAALGPQVCAVDHIGSTAIPGLDAKPVVDLIAGVPNLQLSESFFPIVAGVGYEHRHLDTVPGRLYFIKGPENARTHSLSVCEHDSVHWTLRLRFRDRLRQDPVLAARYQALKHRLAEAFPGDRLAYTEGKTAFIEAVVR
jgi:GrpB-like predicted nucleotidyltransferase (UPF0157 family)